MFDEDFEDDIDTLDQAADLNFVYKTKPEKKKKSAAKAVKKSKRPRKPQPWDDDWQDPEDSY